MLNKIKYKITTIAAYFRNWLYNTRITYTKLRIDHVHFTWNTLVCDMVGLRTEYGNTPNPWQAAPAIIIEHSNSCSYIK